METRYPHVEEHIRGILDEFHAAFVDSTQQEPGPTLRKSWIAGARRLVADLGEDAAFIPWAIEQMQQRGLLGGCKSPGSLVFLVPEWRKLKMAPRYGVCPECFLVGMHAADCPFGDLDQPTMPDDALGEEEM